MTFTIQEIMDFLPHRYPFLLIDRIVEFERAKRVVAIKNVTMNEPFFQGHFPGAPLMPGVLIVEAMAQAGAVLLLSEMKDRHSKLAVFTGIDGAKFRRSVTPGDQLRIEVDVVSFRPRAGKMEGKAYVDGKLACEATLTCMIVPRAQGAKPSEAAQRTYIPARSLPRERAFRNPVPSARFAPSVPKSSWARIARSSRMWFSTGGRASGRATRFILFARSAWLRRT